MPKPGLVGEPDIDIRTDHPSEHILRFYSKASEAEIRSAFEAYCARLGLHRSDSHTANKEETWFESNTQGFGIAFDPPDADPALLRVWVFHGV